MAGCGGKDEDSLSRLMQKNLRISDHVEIRQKLNEMESPFSWKLPSQEHDSIDVMRKEMKLKEMDYVDKEISSWRAFVLNIVLCHHYTVKGNEYRPCTAAFEKLSECEYALHEERSSTFFSMEGLNHILQATRAYLLFYSEKFQEAGDLLGQITHPKDMDKKCLATICGVHAAAFMEFGYEGVKRSMTYVERAIELEPDCGDWHFLLGRALGRLRKIEDNISISDKQELQALEKACALAPHKSYVIYLARSYREISRSIYFNRNYERNITVPYCSSLNKKSLNMYRRLLEYAEENAHVYIDCGWGFLKLPKPYQNRPLVKECIEKALAIFPDNTSANRLAGTYYSMTDDVESAIKHLKVAAEAGYYSSCMDLVVLQFNKLQNYDPVPDLEILYERFKKSSFQETVLCYLGTYFYFERCNFKKALEYWLKIIELNIHAEKLQAFHSRLMNRSYQVNINEIIVKEILMGISDGNLNREEDELYKRLLARYSEHHPDLVKVLTTEK